jgi:CubicO group peptidase (beta-lactamase class C family)
MTWAGPPLFQAGTGWNYCNTNYLLAGLIAESATGRSYSQLLRDTILTPLQLDSTFLDVYEPILFPVAHPWQGGMNFNATPRTSINSAAWSAGAMYSTSGEMLQWYRALMGGMVINAQSMNELTTFVGSGNYGMGISRVTVLGRTVWTHGGLIWGGYNSSMMYDPATGIVICVLINQLPAQANQLSIQLLSTLLSNPLTIHEPSMTERHMNVYPNPIRSRVELDVPNQTILHVQVYDRKGMLVQETPDRVLDLSHEPSGLYFIRVQTAKGYYNGKLIKQ